MFFFKKKKTKDDFLRDLSRQEGSVNGTVLSVINYLTDGILVFNSDNKLILINPQAENYLDLDGKEALGREVLHLSRFPGARPLVSFLGGGIKECYKEELKIEENFILEASAIPMIVKESKLGSLVILRDITHEKLIDKLKSEFVTVAAHQLRTPASIMKWTIKTLLEEDSGPLTEEQKEALGRVFSTNEKMIRLINDLLNVAQIEEGKYLSKLVISDIKEIIKTSYGSFEGQLKKRKIKFVFKVPKTPLPKVMLDREKMIIALNSLIDNAGRYTPQGGNITVSIEEKEKEIEVGIKDNGLGISFEDQTKISTKFFRGRNAARVDTEGTGLGLYIAKNIIEAHGGRFWFDSEEGKGSNFYFTVPVKERFGEYITKEFY